MKCSFTRKAASLATVILFILALSSCSMSVNDKGEPDKVDIRTPVGGLHVGSDVDPKDTGLPVYPGSRRKPEEKGKDSNNASVTIASSLFGIKVAAVTYDTDDPPEKLVSFYKNELLRFGKVLQCHGKSGNDVHVDIHESKDKKSKQVTCDKDDGGSNVVELKVGTEDNQHLVSIEPHDKGSEFSLVYIQARGKREPI